MKRGREGGLRGGREGGLKRRRTGGRAGHSGPLLACRGLEVAYGRTPVLFGIDVEVDAGEVLAVLGTNGAGKSTLLRAISGLTPPRRGRVVLDGRDVTGASPVRRAALGLSHMPGGRGVFGDLSVGENLRMAAWRLRRDAARQAVGRALELFPVLESRLGEQAGLLSGGQQQMLALAQALVPAPRLLLIDELSLGLAPVVVNELLPVVRRLRDGGVAVVLVEQSVEVALAVADRAVFLERGEVRFCGPAPEIARRGDLVRSVFLAGGAGGGGGGGASFPLLPGNGDGDGAFSLLADAAGAHAGHGQAPLPADSAAGGLPSDSAGRRPADSAAGGRPALRARGLRKAFGGLHAVDGVDLDVAAGEIVGLMGPNGAGKTTVLDLLSGFVTPDTGTVHLGGDELTHLSPEVRARRGLGRSFQDARLFPGLTVAETLAVSCERWVSSREPLAAALRLPASLLSETEVAGRVEWILAVLGLGVFRDRFAAELSTGSRRLVEFGCLLAQEPDVLLLDEPSAGLARADSDALAPMLRRLGDVTGAGIILVEHDVALLRAACDRIVALDGGRVLTAGPPGAVLDDPLVVAAYLGTAPVATGV